MGVAIGIDLGTTNSCVAVVQDNKARVVVDKEGRRIQPSVVSCLPDGTTLAGQAARERLIIDPSNTIYSFKRLIGGNLASPEMKALLAELPYEVRLGMGNIPAIKTYKRDVTLPEVSAIMLRHLREMCSEALGIPVTDAVITVPANFTDVQRSSTKVAGRIAGFNVLRILNEPTAAALAYGVGSQSSEKIAIYDFGGGTFDITIVEVSNDIYEVLSTAGDTFLGGDDFDKLILREMIDAFALQHQFDFSVDQKARQRARSVAERVKCQLSSIDDVNATLKDFTTLPSGTPVDFEFHLKRERFEELSLPLVERSFAVCEEALKLAGLTRNALNSLIFVGGTTRIPLIRQRAKEFFGRTPLDEINPDEVVAIGAAIQAFSLTGVQIETPQQPTLPASVKGSTQIGLPAFSSPGSKTPDGAHLPPPLPALLNLPVKTAAVSSEVRSELEDLSTEAHLEPPTIPPLPAPVARPTEAIKVKDSFQFPDLSFDVSSAESLPPLPADAEEICSSTPSSQPPLPNTVAPLLTNQWFGVLADVPLPGAENDEVVGLPGLRSLQPAPLPAGFGNDAAAAPPSPIPADAFHKAAAVGFANTMPMGSSVPLAFPIGPMSAPAAALPSTPPPPLHKQPIAQTREYPVTEKAALLLDVTPRGLGVATAGGFCDSIIDRNAAIPIEQSRFFNTSTDNQTEVSVDIYQGESRRIVENTLLGQVVLSNIRPAPRGEIRIRVTFEIDTDGILRVSARNEETKAAQNTRIALSGGLDDDAVADLVRKYAHQ